MELVWITAREQLEQYRADWSLILEVNQNTNPFIEFDWINEWWRYLGNDCKVEIVAVIHDKKPVAFFPFLYKRSWFGYTYNFMAFGQANYMDFIAYEDVLDSVIKIVFDEIIRIRKNVVFSLHGLLESVGTPERIETYLVKQNFVFSIHRVITPYIDLEKIKLNEYMRERQRLHRLDRREKKLRSIGNVAVEQTKIEEMECIFKLHEKQWEKKHDTSGFTNEKEKNFYRSLACIQDGPMKTEIDSLYINDSMIAFNYGFNCRGRFLGYVLGFDHDFEGFSPGRILEKEKILQCKYGDYQTFDLSIGYETYKFDWNTDIDYTRKMIFSSNTIIANTSRFFLSMKETIIERIKKNYKIVLFKRNKVGKLLYILRNLFNKSIWRDFERLLIRWRKFIFECNRYIVYMIERKEIIDVPSSGSFLELTLADALNDPIIAGNHMKEICRKIYGGYKGYYPGGKLTFENIFWTNEKVLRIDSISYIENFKKSSVYVVNWKKGNLAEVCSYVKRSSNARTLYVTIKDDSESRLNLLEVSGFSISKKIYRRTFLGFRKYRITEWKVGSENYHYNRKKSNECKN